MRIAPSPLSPSRSERGGEGLGADQKKGQNQWEKRLTASSTRKMRVKKRSIRSKILPAAAATAARAQQQTVSGSDSRRRGPGQDIDPVLPADRTLLSGRCSKLLSGPHAVHMPVVCCGFMRARDLHSSLRAIRHSCTTRYRQKRTRSGKTEDPGCRLRGSLCPISGSRFIPPGKGDTLLPSDA